MTEFDVTHSPDLLMLCAAASVAGFIRGFAGFGGPATMSLMLAHFFVPATLLPKIALLDFYAYPVLVWNVRREARWRLSIPMALATVALLPFSLHAMTVLDPIVTKRLIGGVALGAVLVSMCGFRLKREPPLFVHLAISAVLGAILGMTFIALPIVAYVLMMPFSAASCRATVLSFSVMTMPCLIGMMFYRGMAAAEDILPVAVAGSLYFATVWLGAKAFSRASDRNYRRVAECLLLGLCVTILA